MDKFYVYVIKSKEGYKNTGMTEDLKLRLKQHNDKSLSFLLWGINAVALAPVTHKELYIPLNRFNGFPFHKIPDRFKGIPYPGEQTPRGGKSKPIKGEKQ